MSWEALGFVGCPFKTEPISEDTLNLFVGHKEEIDVCKSLLKDKEIILVVEGARGVGTTSFANYLRFSAYKIKDYFTPKNEIRVEANWKLETLLAAVISNIVRELDLTEKSRVSKDKRFTEAKALSKRISETYRSFGLSVFGTGASYGGSGGASQPILVPSTVLGHHLEDLSSLAISLGYKKGILIQLNNMDIGAIHSEDYLKYILNALRDYMQTRNTSWFLVGDKGLRAFISRKVDRVDDIISYETFIEPLHKEDYRLLVRKRVNFYRKNKNAILPVQQEVFEYLYDITEGRLRYVFGLLQRLMKRLRVGSLIDMVTLEVAKPMIIELARNRIRSHELTTSEEVILTELVKLKESSVKKLIEKTKKNRAFVSRILNKFLKLELVSIIKKGTLRVYTPSLDAKIAYAEIKE